MIFSRKLIVSLNVIKAVRDATKQGGVITCSAVAERVNISYSHAESTLLKLREKNILVSIRGPGGGYCFNNDMSGDLLKTIIFAITGTTRITGSENTMLALMPEIKFIEFIDSYQG